MFVVTAYGGEYDESWQRNLFYVKDEGFAKEMVSRLEKTVQAYEKAWNIFEPNLTNLVGAFKKNYIATHAKPKMLASIPKPIHPKPHHSIQGMRKKDKIGNPYQALYLEEYNKYKADLIPWEQIEKENFYVKFNYDGMVNDACETFSSEMKKEYFKPQSFLPKEYEDHLSKNEIKFLDANSFHYEKLVELEKI